MTNDIDINQPSSKKAKALRKEAKLSKSLYHLEPFNLENSDAQ